MAGRALAERRALQFAVAVAACVPVAAGLAGVLTGQDFLSGDADLTAAGDGHVRYLSGLLLAIGLGFWSAVPGIHRKAARFRVLAAVVIVGGLARLYGFLLHPELNTEILLPLVMELLVTPTLLLWRERVGGGARIFGH